MKKWFVKCALWSSAAMVFLAVTLPLVVLCLTFPVACFEGAHGPFGPNVSFGWPWIFAWPLIVFSTATSVWLALRIVERSDV